MTKFHILNLYNTLINIKGHLGVSFNLGLEDNREQLEPIVKPLHKEATRITEILKKFDGDRITKVKELADKDANGEPIYDDKLKKYALNAENAKALDVFMETLKVTHKKDWALYNKEMDAYELEMNKECTRFKPILIPRSKLPETLTTQEIRSLYRILDKK